MDFFFFLTVKGDNACARHHWGWKDIFVIRDLRLRLQQETDETQIATRRISGGKRVIDCLKFRVSTHLGGMI